MKHKAIRTINKRVYRSFLASYMTIFMFSLVICIIMLSVTLTQSSAQYAETGLLSVKQLQNIVDTKLNELDSVSRMILSQKEINSIRYYSYPYNARQIYSLREIKQLLIEEVSRNDMMNEIYLRFENSDSILSSKTIYHGEEVAQNLQSDLLVDYDTFLDSLVFDGIKTFYITSEGDRKEIYMVRKLTMSKPGSPSMVSLITRLDMSSFSTILDSLSIGSEYSITIADSVNRVLLGGVKFKASNIIDTENVHSIKYIKALLNGKPITFIRPSSITGWNYHFTVQVDNSNIIIAIAILLVCLILSIVGGLFLCVILAKKQYVPVDKLLTQLDVEGKELVTDEYNAIRSQIEKLQNDSKKIEKYTEKYYALLRKKVLTDLILGDNVSLVEKALREDPKLLPLLSDSFLLLCIFSTKLPESPVLYAGINHMEVLAASLTDKVRDYFHDTATVYSVTINHAIYLLINPSEELNDEGVSSLYKDLFEIISEVRSYILQSMDMALSAAVSNPHHSVKNINDAYLETESVREIIMQNPNFSPILCYHELHRSENDVANKKFREQDIITYVNINFADQDMCLKTPAAKYNLSTPYISRIFKKSTGNTLTDYIHMLRLNLAKKYLAEGMTLNDISEKCGYANTLTLIRAFKKYEGVTPSEYKKKKNGKP